MFASSRAPRLLTIALSDVRRSLLFCLADRPKAGRRPNVTSRRAFRTLGCNIDQPGVQQWREIVGKGDIARGHRDNGDAGRRGDAPKSDDRRQRGYEDRQPDHRPFPDQSCSFAAIPRSNTRTPDGLTEAWLWQISGEYRRGASAVTDVTMLQNPAGAPRTSEQSPAQALPRVTRVR
jgi:hypothetical protein